MPETVLALEEPRGKKKKKDLLTQTMQCEMLYQKRE